jgi:hypothetical protein
VPTDPFVPADPSSRPRQQQNLPPGVALPPASSWRPDRPGDLGPGQPRGQLLGTPGPNVGYAYTLVERVKNRLRIGPHEHLDDVIAVVAEIAAKRAAVSGRAPVINDVELAMALLGYDGSASAPLVEAREQMVHGAGHEYARRRALIDGVPEALLCATGNDVKDEIDSWRARATSELVPDLREMPTM